MNEEKELQNDYFINRTNHTYFGDVDSVIKQIGDEPIKLESRDKLWENKDIKERYEKQYGKDARLEFDNTYDHIQGEFNAIEYNKQRKKEYKDIDNNNPYFDQKMNAVISFQTVDPDITGQTALAGGTKSEKTRSFREASLNSGVVYDYKNEPIYTAPIDESLTAKILKGVDALGLNPGASQLVDKAGPYSMINNPKFTDANGNMIKGFVYLDEDKQRDENGFIRSGRGLKALYYGEHEGKNEVVTNTDLLNLTKPGLEGTWVSGIPRAIYGTVSNLVKGVNNTAMSAVDAINARAEDQFKKSPELLAAYKKQMANNSMMNFMEKVDMSAKQGEWSISDASKESLFTGENVSTFIADVAIQLAVARGAGIAGGAAAQGLNASSKATMAAAKYSSLVPLTLMAVSDSRDNAIAAGYTKEQAAYYHFAMLGAMFAVNKAFSWVDDGIDAKKVLGEANELIEKRVAENTAKLGGNLTDAQATTIADEAATMFSGVLKHGKKGLEAVKSFTSGSKGTYGDILKESLEETSETWAEYAVKGLTNTVTGEDKFMTTSNPEYWKQFWQETGMSAVGGALGAGMFKTGEKLFASKSTTPEERNQIVHFVLEGKDKEFNKILLEQYEAGKLGSKELSVNIDPRTGAFKSMNDDKDLGVSQADAQLKLLQNQYNDIKTMVSLLGAPEVINRLKTDKTFGDADLSVDIADKVGNLTKEYLDLTVNKGYSELLPNIKKASQSADLDEAAKALTEEFNSNNAISNTGNTIDIATTKRLLEIFKETEDIRSGKANTNFILDNITKKLGSSSIDNIGADFFSKLNDLSFTTVKNTDEQLSSAKEKLIENDALLMESSKDLSAIQDFFLNKGNKVHVNQYGKILISKNVKEEFEKNLAIILEESNDVKAVIKGMQQELKVAEKEMLEYIKTPEFLARFNESGTYNTIEDLENFIKEYYKGVSDTRNILNVQNTGFLTKSGLLTLAIDEELQNGIRQLTVDMLVNNGQDYVSKVKVTENNKEFVERLQNTFTAINFIQSQIADNSDLNATEYTTALESEQGNAFLTNFDIDKSGKYILGDLLNTDMNRLLDDYNEMTINGVSRFNKLEEAKDLKLKIIARKEQLEALSLASDLLIDFKVRQLKILNPTTIEEAKEIFKETSSSEKIKLYEQIKEWGINPDIIAFSLYRQAKNLDNKEDKEVIDNAKRTEEKINKDIEALDLLLAKVNMLVAEATKNVDTTSKFETEKADIAKSVKLQLQSLKDLFILQSDKLVDLKNYESVRQKVINYTITLTDTSKETLLKDKQLIYNISELLLQTTKEQKRNILEDILVDEGLTGIVKNTNTDATRDTKRNSFLTKILPLYVPIQKVDNKIQAILESSFAAGKKRAITVEQELIAWSIIAHATSDITEDWYSIMKTNPTVVANGNPPDLSNIMLILGLAGTGKTTFCNGYGVKIAQEILQERYGKEQTGVLLSSKDQKKIDSLYKTATEPEYKLDLLNSATGGLTFEQLRDLPEDNLKNVSLLVLDEVTLASYDQTSESDADMNIIIKKVNAINTRRKLHKQPLLKIVTLGDNSQNGVYKIRESDGAMIRFNLVNNEEAIFGPSKISFNFRSKVSAIVDFAASLKASRQSADFLETLPSSKWGKFKNDEHKLAGVRAEKKSFLNDVGMIQHLKDMIATYQAAGEVFKIVVASDDMSVLENTELYKMYIDKQYEKNFIEVASHDGVQGSEADYAFVIVDKSMKPGLKLNEQRVIAKKLATSIERARFHTVLINDSDLNITSEGGHEFSLPLDYFDPNGELITQVKDYRAAILPDKNFYQKEESLKGEIVVEEKKDNPEKAGEPEVQTPVVNTDTDKKWADLINNAATEDLKGFLTSIPENELTPELIELITKRQQEAEQELNEAIAKEYDEFGLRILAAKERLEFESIISDIKESTLLNEEQKNNLISTISLPEENAEVEETPEAVEENIQEQELLKEKLSEELNVDLDETTVEELTKLQDEETDNEKKALINEALDEKAEQTPEYELDNTVFENNIFKSAEELKAEHKEKAEEINREFHKAGWLTAYVAPEHSKGTTYNYVNSVRDKYKEIGVEFPNSEAEYKELQLEALKYKKSNNLFTYKLHIVRDKTSERKNDKKDGKQSENTIEILATDKNGKSVIFAQALMSKLLSDMAYQKSQGDKGVSVGIGDLFNLVDKLKEHFPEKESVIMPINPEYIFDINDLIKPENFIITSGGLNVDKQSQFTLDDLKLHNPDVVFSDIFITTSKLLDLNNGGIPFVFYTKNKNTQALDLLSDASIIEMMKHGLPMFNPDNANEAPAKGFKNGIGMIILSNNYIGFQDIYKLSNRENNPNPLNLKDVEDFNKWNIISFFKDLAEKIAPNELKISNEYSKIRTFAKAFEDYKSTLTNNILKPNVEFNTAVIKKNQDKFKDVLLAIVSDEHLLKIDEGTSNYNLQSGGVLGVEVNTKGDDEGLITHKSLRVNMRKFQDFFELHKGLDNNVTFAEFLEFLDDVKNTTNSKPLFSISVKAIHGKAAFKNKLFAKASASANLDFSVRTNVVNITSPFIRMRSSVLQDIILDYVRNKNIEVKATENIAVKPQTKNFENFKQQIVEAINSDNFEDLKESLQKEIEDNLTSKAEIAELLDLLENPENIQSETKEISTLEKVNKIANVIQSQFEKFKTEGQELTDEKINEIVISTLSGQEKVLSLNQQEIKDTLKILTQLPENSEIREILENNFAVFQAIALPEHLKAELKGYLNGTISFDKLTEEAIMAAEDFEQYVKTCTKLNLKP